MTFYSVGQNPPQGMPQQLGPQQPGEVESRVEDIARQSLHSPLLTPSPAVAVPVAAAYVPSGKGTPSSFEGSFVTAQSSAKESDPKFVIKEMAKHYNQLHQIYLWAKANGFNDIAKELEYTESKRAHFKNLQRKVEKLPLSAPKINNEEGKKMIADAKQLVADWREKQAKFIEARTKWDGKTPGCVVS